MAYVSRSPPIIPDGQISRVRFETLAFLRRPSQVWRGLNAGPLRPRHSGLPPASRPDLSWRYAGFIKPTAIQPRKPPSVLSPFAQLRCYLRWGDVSAISSEGVTPPSSLCGLMCHSHSTLSCFGISPRSKSLGRLYAVPAAHGSFPTLSPGAFPWMLDPVPRRSHRVLSPVSSTMSSAFPKERLGRLPLLSRVTTSRRPVFRGCRYSLMFRPPRFLAPEIVPAAANTTAGQPGLLRPGLSCFVASARTGYANRPNSGN